MVQPNGMGAGNEERLVCPLFPEPVNDKGKLIFADEVKRFQLSRVMRGPRGLLRRPKVPVDEFYNRETDTWFELDPFTTTEDDIEQHFGGGEYWIEAFGHNGQVMPGGRVMTFGGAPKKPWMGRRRPDGEANDGHARRPPPEARDASAYDEEGDEGDEMQMDPRNPRGFHPPFYPQHPGAQYGMPYGQQPYGMQYPGMNPMMGGMMPGTPDPFQKLIEAQQQMMQQMREVVDKRADDAQRWAAMSTQNNAQNAGARDDLVTALREELDEARRNNLAQVSAAMTKHQAELDRKAAEIEDLRKEHRRELESQREELASRRRALEEELRAARAGFDRQMDDERKRRERDVEDEKKRRDREIEDERKRHEGEVRDIRTRLEMRIADLEKTSLEVRTRLEKRVEEQLQEITDLRRDLADTPRPNEPPPPPPPGAPGPATPGAPWYANMMAQWAGPIVTAVAEYAKTNSARAATPVANPAPQPQLQPQAPPPPPPAAYPAPPAAAQAAYFPPPPPPPPAVATPSRAVAAPQSPPTSSPAPTSHPEAPRSAAVNSPPAPEATPSVPASVGISTGVATRAYRMGPSITVSTAPEPPAPAHAQVPEPPAPAYAQAPEPQPAPPSVPPSSQPQAHPSPAKTETPIEASPPSAAFAPDDEGNEQMAGWDTPSQQA
jgi:hypothetical protein